MKKTKILVFGNDFKSGVSFYRYGLPFVYLQKYNDNIEVTHVKQFELDFITVPRYDIIVLWSPGTVQDLKVVQVAKSFGVKVWIDIDDYAHEIPLDNPYKQYHDESWLKIFEEIIHLADVVTVSTPGLKTAYGELNKNIHVVKNAFPMELIPQPVVPAKNNYITWRGGQSHFGDLFNVREELKEVAFKHRTWDFNFVGDYPAALVDYKTNQPLFPFKHHRWNDSVLGSIQYLQMLSSKIHIIPLTANPFNACKSNIAWIEATLAGSICVTPSWFNAQDGMKSIVYTSFFSIKKAVSYLIENPTKCNDTWDDSFNDINDNYSLKKINKQRLKIAIGL